MFTVNTNTQKIIEAEKILALGKPENLAKMDFVLIDAAGSPVNAENCKFSLQIGDVIYSNYKTDANTVSFRYISIAAVAPEAAFAVILKKDDAVILTDSITVTADVIQTGGSADLGSYVGEVSITGDVDGSTADILNYTKTGQIGTVTVGWNNPNYVAQPTADTYNNNLFFKGWMLGIIGGYQVLINAGGQTITVNKNQGIDLDASDLLWKGRGLNYGNGLCLLNSSGNVPFYVSEPYINKNDSYGDIWFRFNSDSKIDWYTHYGEALTFYDDGDFYFQYPDTLTKRMEDNCITKEIWVTPSENITTILIPEYMQVIGDMPETLQATKEILWNETPYTRALTHIFVVRGINYNGRWIYTINYSHNFISDYTSIFN